MIKELHKRPLTRPLLIWITGIILQTWFQLTYISVGILILLFAVLIVSVFTTGQVKKLPYVTRWNWGVVFFSGLLFLSIQLTSFHQTRIKTDNSWDLPVQLREKMLDKIDNLNLNNSEKSVLATITLGYKQSLTKEDRNKFSITGVAHLLAVSGFHVAVVANFLGLLFFFCPNNRVGSSFKYIGVLLLVWTYILITGFALSAIRAGLMFSFYLTAKQLRRRTDSYNILAAAAFFMLVYNPFFLYDVGFQLSFMAVWSILLLQPRFNRIIQVRNPVIRIPWETLTVTLAAQIGVTFICIYYFGYISTVFLLSNIPVSLLATLLVPCSLFYFLLPETFPFTVYVGKVIEMFVSWIYGVVDFFNHPEYVVWRISIDAATVICLYLLLLILFYYSRFRRIPVPSIIKKRWIV